VNFQSVLSLAPLRVSFLGGGSDIPNFYEKHTGAVVSAAINKYVYVHIKRHDPLFQERYRISYSEIEHTQNRAEIKNSIVRSCLELLEIDEPLQISTSADLPANSGLGSSSSFAVALLLGLHAIRGEEVSPVQVAEEACRVEIEILKSPIGKQDQYAAAFGGLNYFEFKANGTVKIEPIYLSNIDTGRLLERSILIWTGQTRKADAILSDQALRASKNLDQLIAITELAAIFKNELLKPNLNWSELGSLISQGWTLKKSFSTKITTPEVQEITSKLDKINCYGYKLLGAGGGGFIFSLMEESKISTVEDLEGWRTFRPELDQLGARIVSLK
jgi:D-glycero-alpha-D-manno-heptose-7-phosphate kinase